MDIRRAIAVLSLELGILAAPLATPAQPGAKIPRIGVFGSSPALMTSRQAAFREGLHELGYVEGQNVTIEYRGPGGATLAIRRGTGPHECGCHCDVGIPMDSRGPTGHDDDSHCGRGHE